MTPEQTTRILTADEAGMALAADALKRGELVAFPTETVYGLGADASQDSAVAAIFAAKSRPRFNPLIVHFASTQAAAEEVAFDDRAWALAGAFWPGPLTLVLPRRPGSRISRLCSAGLESLAVRVPRHPVGQKLLALAGIPLAAPSANASGRLSPTTAEHVRASLEGRIPFILDGGAAKVGLESTVIDLTAKAPLLLRPGGLASEALEALIGPLGAADDSPDRPRAPGMLESHYAPALPLRRNSHRVAEDEALLAFGPCPLEGAAATINLSVRGDLTEAAARLFSALHELDRPEFRAIAAMPIPEEGLGLAINDRLRRAAAAPGEVPPR